MFWLQLFQAICSFFFGLDGSCFYVYQGAEFPPRSALRFPYSAFRQACNARTEQARGGEQASGEGAPCDKRSLEAVANAVESVSRKSAAEQGASER